MKDLTYQELLDAPHLIQFIYTASMIKQPLGSEMIEKALNEHPEYFPDELEHRRKWALIPQDVHDEYNAERNKLHEEIFKDMPPSKGLLGWLNDPVSFQKWNDEWEKCRSIEKPLAEKLHQKYYAKYGIEYNGW